MKRSILFALTFAFFFLISASANAAVMTFTDRAAFLSASASIGTSTTIDFATRDDGSPITNPSSDVYFENLSLSGVNFRQSRSYYNLFLYNFPNAEIRAELPPNTLAFGADITDFYNAGATYTVTLSTGESFSFPPPTAGWEFFGVISDTPVEWVSFKLAGDYLALDNFTFVVNPTKTVRIDIAPGSYLNIIYLSSPVSTVVHIFSSHDFDARTIDPSTIRLAGAGVKLKTDGTPMVTVRDLNRDRRPDLAVHIITSDMQLNLWDTEAALEASTYNGTIIKGSDSVWVQP